jgi:phosphomannomutase/phosphoglucomutase
LRQRYEVVEIDGVRVLFPQGWGLVRASNTQPVLVLRFEAATRELLEQYRAQVESVLARAAG